MNKTCSECQCRIHAVPLGPRNIYVILCPKHAAVDELAKALRLLIDSEGHEGHPKGKYAPYGCDQCFAERLARQALAKLKETQP